MDVLVVTIKKKSNHLEHGQLELFELIIVVGQSYPSTITAIY